MLIPKIKMILKRGLNYVSIQWLKILGRATKYFVLTAFGWLRTESIG
jgi:hypothetical protein